MKKIISSATAFALLLPMLLTPSVSAAGEAVSYSRKEVTGYLFGMDSSETFSCLFRPDMNIPYISAADFLNQIYTAAFTTTKNSDGTYSVTNKNGAKLLDGDGNPLLSINFYGLSPPAHSASTSSQTALRPQEVQSIFISLIIWSSAVVMLSDFFITCSSKS